MSEFIAWSKFKLFVEYSSTLLQEFLSEESMFLMLKNTYKFLVQWITTSLFFLWPVVRRLKQGREKEHMHIHNAESLCCLG